MMSYRAVSLLVMGLLVIGLAYVGYRWIDVSISYGYASSGEDEANANNKRLRRLLLAASKGSDKARVALLLKSDAEAYPNEHILIKEDGSSIWYDGVEFRFSERGILVGVGQGVGEPSPQTCGNPGAPTDRPCLPR